MKEEENYFKNFKTQIANPNMGYKALDKVYNQKIKELNNHKSPTTILKKKKDELTMKLQAKMMAQMFSRQATQRSMEEKKTLNDPVFKELQEKINTLKVKIVQSEQNVKFEEMEQQVVQNKLSQL